MSSSANASLALPVLPSNSTTSLCFTSPISSKVFFGFALANIVLLLPVTSLVLHVGVRRWRRRRRRRSVSTATATSHSDRFTYHMVALETLGLTGCACFCIGASCGSDALMKSGFYSLSLLFPGQTSFHVLTCVERYLAVVHPVTYLGLRRETRITSATIGGVWLLCFAWTLLLFLYFPYFPTNLIFIITFLSLLVIFFCQTSVLCALTDPPPGDGRRVHQTKQRAFHTIVVIAAVLFLRFVGLLVCLFLYEHLRELHGDPCVVLSCAYWLCLPSSLVLPLLFLHRTGALACRRPHDGGKQTRFEWITFNN